MASIIGATRLVWLVAILVYTFHANTPINAKPTGSESSHVSTSSTGINANSSVGELILVQVIFRHGDRTPISIYTNDPYKNYTWDEGLGSLTLRGKSRMYNYGTVLKKRYSDYIESILPKNIIAQSSFKRRCIESTLAVLAGLFPPTNTKTTWSKSQELAKLWQPIAVSTTEKSRAWLLNPDTTCAAADEIRNALPNDDPEMKKFLQENKEFVETVSKYTGQQFPSWVEVGWIFDSIFTERLYFGDKFEMPAWLAQVGNDTLTRLKMFNDFQFSIYAKWPKFVKLRAGLLLKQLIDNMKMAATQKTQASAKKESQMALFGTHDTLVSPIMLALGYLKEQPTYGSGLLVELRRNAANPSVPNVHIFYANVTSNEAIDDFNVVITPLALNQSERFSKLCHEAHCSLDNFATSLKDFLVTDIESECAAPKR